MSGTLLSRKNGKSIYKSRIYKSAISYPIKKDLFQALFDAIDITRPEPLDSKISKYHFRNGSIDIITVKNIVLPAPKQEKLVMVSAIIYSIL
jgi:hypothetical protein